MKKLLFLAPISILPVAAIASCGSTTGNGNQDSNESNNGQDSTSSESTIEKIDKTTIRSRNDEAFSIDYNAWNSNQRNSSSVTEYSGGFELEYSDQTWSTITKLQNWYLKQNKTPSPFMKMYRIENGNEVLINDTTGRYDDWNELKANEFPGWLKEVIVSGLDDKTDNYVIKYTRNNESHKMLILGEKYKTVDEALEFAKSYLESNKDIDMLKIVMNALPTTGEGSHEGEDGYGQLVDWSLLPSQIKKLQINMGMDAYQNNDAYQNANKGNFYKSLYGLAQCTFLEEIELNAPYLTDIIPSSLPLGVYFQKNQNIGPKINIINLSNIPHMTARQVSIELYISHVLQANNWIFQGPLYGEGGYPVNLDLSGTLINTLEGIEIPQRTDGRENITWVGMTVGVDVWEYDVNKGLTQSSVIQDIWYGDSSVEKLVLKGKTTKETAIQNIYTILKQYPVSSLIINDPSFQLVETIDSSFNQETHDRLWEEVKTSVENLLKRPLPTIVDL